MIEKDKYTEGVFNRSIIEFVTVASESCLFIESAANFTKEEFLLTAQKMLPLLYLKTSMLKVPEMLLSEEPERFVSETDYAVIKQSIAEILGSSDRYLEVFHPDIQLSEEGIATDISEDLADIYQDLKDFLLCYQIGNEEVMNDALAVCLNSFKEYWGQRLVNSLRALHNTIYNKDENEEEEMDTQQTNSLKENFLSHQYNEEMDAFLNSKDNNDED